MVGIVISVTAFTNRGCLEAFSGMATGAMCTGLNGLFEPELGGSVVRGSRTQWEPGLTENVGISVRPLGTWG